MLRHPLLWLLAGMAAALGFSLLLLHLTLRPQPGDLQQLMLVMGATGISSVVLAYIIHQQSVVRWFSSLRWTLLISILLPILLIVPNVWITAQWMFISTHDLYLTLGLLVFGGLTAITFGHFVAGVITERLRAFSGAAEALAAGRLETRLSVQGNDELADFAATFNWMAARLEALDSQKRQMEQARRDLIAGVSHDLRTPLTALRAMLEAMQDEVVTDPADQQRYLRNALGEIENLSHLIDDLFELAKLDAGHLRLEIQPASLRDLISDTLSGVRLRALSRQLALHAEVQPDLEPIPMAPDKIQRVLHNLLDNALRYTPTPGSISIRAWGDEAGVQVAVQNTGSIPAAHLPHIFESFYRVDASRHSAEDIRRSTGLGLAIAKGFVEAHGGSIQVQSSPEAGTCFSFSLPYKPAAPNSP